MAKPEWAIRDQWYQRCGCGGRKWLRTSYWQGDADWAVYTCDKCSEELHTAGCWSYVVPAPKPVVVGTTASDERGGA